MVSSSGAEPAKEDLSYGLANDDGNKVVDVEGPAKWKCHEVRKVGEGCERTALT